MTRQGIRVTMRGGAESRAPRAVGIWVRVSTEEQAQGDSPKHHELRARMYAESRGWTVVELYDLSGWSGKSVMEHPETKRMLADLHGKRISGLIFSKLARLARNTRELLDFADIFREADADLISLQEAIDTSTPAGRLFYTILAAMAHWEREEIADRVAASVPIRAKLGKPTGGAAPFGYRWKDDRLEIDAQEAPVRRRIYELFLTERRLKTVARLLNEAGHRTRKGALFTHTTVERLIRDPTAKGLRRANYTKSLGEGKKWVLKPESEWVTSTVSAIIDEALWAECNRLLDERRQGERPGPKPVHLFTGLVSCVCGQKMYVPSNTPKYVCYGCRNKVPEADLEAVFVEQLRGLLLSPEALAEHLAAADTRLGEQEALLKSLEGEHRSSCEEGEKLYRLYLAGGLSPQGFGERNRPLEARLGELEEEIPRLQGEIDFRKMQRLNEAHIVAEARDLYTRWNDLAFEERRTLVENLMERVTVGKDEIAFDLRDLPALRETVAEGARKDMAALPFCHLTIAGPRPDRFAGKPRNLAEHLRKHRMGEGSTQAQACGTLGVDPDTLSGWERGQRQPSVWQWPAIVAYLGYEPWRPPGTLGETIRARRFALGLSQRELGQSLGLDPGTVSAWERSCPRRRTTRARRILEAWLKGSFE